MKIDNLCRALRDLRDNGPATNRELSDELEVSINTVWHWTAKLQAWGLIRRCGLRADGSVIFELAPKDEPLGKKYTPPRRSKRPSS